jgi:hypothetical protein
MVIGITGEVIIGITVAGVAFIVLLVIGTYVKRRLAKGSSEKQRYSVGCIICIAEKRVLKRIINV